MDCLRLFMAFKIKKIPSITVSKQPDMLYSCVLVDKPNGGKISSPLNLPLLCPTLSYCRTVILCLLEHGTIKI